MTDRKSSNATPGRTGSVSLSVSDTLIAEVEKGHSLDETTQKASINLAIRNVKRSSSKIVLERLSASKDMIPPATTAVPAASLLPTPTSAFGAASGGPESPNAPPNTNLLSPRSQVAMVLDSTDGEMLFSLPKLCKWFSEQKRPLDLLVKLVRDLRDPKNGMQTTKKLVGLSRVETFPEKDLLTWLVKMKFTAAASTAARIVELLQKDYVICEAKKGFYRFLEKDERAKARVEEERVIEQKVQKKLAELAKDQKKAARKDKKKEKECFPVIGVDLASTMQNQSTDYPTLEVPFLLVRFAADVILLNGQKEEGIFRLSVGTEEVAQMVHQINSENNYTLVRKDPNVAAVMMKRYLRDLPQPLFTDYDGAVRLAKTKADDEQFMAFFDAAPAPNKAVVKFIANFIHKMTRPEVVSATKMDVNNYAIVFTPGFLRSQAVDLAAMANNQFENEFTVRIVTMLRTRFPDDSVGDPEQVPRPYVPPSLTSQHDLRVLVTDTPEMKRPEDLIKEAEERLKNAKRDLHDAKKMEIKEQKKGVVTVGASLRKSSLTKTEGAKIAEKVNSDRTPPPKDLKKSIKSPRDEDTPPKPMRLPPPLSHPNNVAAPQHAPALPSLPPLQPELPDLPPSVPIEEPQLPRVPPPPLPTPASSVEVLEPKVVTPRVASPRVVTPRQQPPDLVSPRVISTPFEQFLSDAKVLDYIDAFHNYGIESIDDLRGLEEDDLDSIGLKQSYRKLLVDMLSQLRTASDKTSPAEPPRLEMQDDEKSDHSAEVDGVLSPEVSRGDVALSPDVGGARAATTAAAAGPAPPKSKRLTSLKKGRRRKSHKPKHAKDVVDAPATAVPEVPVLTVQLAESIAEAAAPVATTEVAAPEGAAPASASPRVHSGELHLPEVPHHDESSDGLSSSESSPRASKPELSELRILLEELSAEVENKNDMGVLRGARACAAKAMEVVAGAPAASHDQAKQIESKIAAINAAVVALVKSEHSDEATADLMGLIRAADALF